MGKLSRDRGARYERKIANVINSALGWDLVRNLEQSRRDVHGDLVDRNTLHAPINAIIECKARKFCWDNVIKWNIKVEESPVGWFLQTYKKTVGRNFDIIWLIFKSTLMDFSIICPVSILYENILLEEKEYFDGFCGYDLYLGSLGDTLEWMKILLPKLKKT